MLQAIYDYNGDPTGNELSFVMGDKVTVLNRDDEGWWFGEMEDGTGE